MSIRRVLSLVRMEKVSIYSAIIYHSPEAWKWSPTKERSLNEGGRGLSKHKMQQNYTTEILEHYSNHPHEENSPLLPSLVQADFSFLLKQTSGYTDIICSRGSILFKLEIWGCWVDYQVESWFFLYRILIDLTSRSGFRLTNPTGTKYL